MTASIPLWIAITITLTCIGIAYQAGALRAAMKLTVAGRRPVVTNADELEELISRRHAKGEPARKGWRSRREGFGG